jgi:hypothetical protein
MGWIISKGANTINLTDIGSVQFGQAGWSGAITALIQSAEKILKPFIRTVM